MQSYRDYNLTRGDYISLGKAVAKFNRTINELKTEENKTYLPNEIEYKELKKNIVVRSDLDRYVKNLRSFDKENSDIYLTEAGEKITSWEREFIKEQSNIALRRMNRQLKQVNKYDKDTIEELKSTIKNVKEFEQKTKGDFKETIKLIHKIGISGYTMKKAIQYRINYYTALEEIKNFKNYELFKTKLDSIKNPISFFNYIQKSSTMSDLFIYYKGNEGIIIGQFTSNEEAFDAALENDYGFKLNKKKK